MQQLVNFNFSIVGVVATSSGVNVEVDAWSRMAMKVSASTQASVIKEDQEMVTLSFALKEVLIFPKHDVKSMAQRVAS